MKKNNRYRQEYINPILTESQFGENRLSVKHTGSQLKAKQIITTDKEYTNKSYYNQQKEQEQSHSFNSILGIESTRVGMGSTRKKVYEGITKEEDDQEGTEIGNYDNPPIFDMTLSKSRFITIPQATPSLSNVNSNLGPLK